jgi:SulP family sulfate permease
VNGLRRYRKEWLRLDVLAGLTAAAVVLPKAMAYATIAGLPLQVGLYTALVPMAVYALFGSSRPLSVSTTTTIATLAMLVGAMLVLAFSLRLGFVANFISEPVLTGFKSAIGLVIVVDQLPKLLGIHVDKTGFLRDIFAILRGLPQTAVNRKAGAPKVSHFGSRPSIPRHWR